MSDVSQGPGWWQASDQKWYPPESHPDHQGQSAASAPPPPTGATPAAAGASAGGATGGQSISFAFDVKRWTQQDRICGIATLVLFISLFLPWYSYSYGIGPFSGSVSVDGLWHGWTYLVLLLSLVIMAYYVAKAGLEEMPTLPLPYPQLLMIATSVNLVLVVLAFVIVPGGVFHGVGFGWSFGSFVGLAAAVVAWVPVGLPFLRGQRSGS